MEEQTSQSRKRTNEERTSKAEKGTNLFVGIILILTGILFIVLHFMLFPIVGLIVGVPCAGIGIYFIAKHRQDLSKPQ